MKSLLTCQNKADDILLIDFTTENSQVFDRHYEVLLMEIDSDQLHIPDMEYEAEFTLSAMTLAFN